MPYFSWVGVNITGDWQKGKRFAKSTDHLDTLLFKQGIALIKTKLIRWRFLQKSITRVDLIAFLEQLSVLINAGILVPQALALVGDQLNNPRLQEVIYILADAVQEGNSLSDAMSKHPKIFDSMTIQHIKVGEESGDLSKSLQSLCTSFETTQQFYNQVRSALVMPMIGVSFFVIISGIIFVVIIPQFADLFAAARQEMPWFTRTIVSMSAQMNSYYGLLVAGLCALCVCIMRAYSKSEMGKKQCDAFCMKIPLIGRIMHTRQLGLFFQSMSMLLSSGMRVVPALQVVNMTIKNSSFARHITALEQAVTSGSSLHHAMAQVHDVFEPYVIAMVAVGEETGQLVPLCDKIAQNYHNQVKKQLAMCTVLLQPLLLIILGLLVVSLIFAVYGPIINLANSMSI